jgi:MFS family permease
LESPRQGIFPPVLAGLVTGLMTWAIAGLPTDWDPADGSLGWIVPLLLVFPFVVSALWGWALLKGHPRKVVIATAGGLLALAFLRLPQDIAWQVAGNAVAGLAAGLALGARWRIDAGLAAVALCLAPVLIWSAVQVPVRESMVAFQDATLESMEETLWSELDQKTNRSLSR